MPIPVLGHLPEFYAVGSAVLALLYWAVKVATGSIHDILDARRDWREFRRGKG
jgi:hypothetical protein